MLFNPSAHSSRSVHINPRTCKVSVTRFVSAIDAGRILNHKTARSQIMGGVIFGIGMALMEETVLDPHNGRLVVRNLADYHVPVHADIGNIEVLFTDKPDPHISRLGVRGVGEIGITGVAAAIALCSVPRDRKAHPGPADYARQTAVDGFILHESLKC